MDHGLVAIEKNGIGIPSGSYCKITLSKTIVSIYKHTNKAANIRFCQSRKNALGEAEALFVNTLAVGMQYFAFFIFLLV